MIVEETCFWVHWGSRNDILGVITSCHYIAGVGYAKFHTTILHRVRCMGWGLGAVIGVIAQGRQPIAFFSKVLPYLHPPSPSRCIMHEKELIPLVKAIQHWQSYLLGRLFTFYGSAPQQSLKFLLNLWRTATAHWYLIGIYLHWIEATLQITLWWNGRMILGRVPSSWERWEQTEVYYTKSEKLVCKLMGEYDIAYQVGNSNKMVDSLFLRDDK
jgi:hypothetical protein